MAHAVGGNSAGHVRLRVSRCSSSPGQTALADTAWVPFGRGARNCIGIAPAQMELTLIIARLAKRIDLVAERTEMPKSVGMAVNRPSGGVPMVVRARA